MRLDRQYAEIRSKILDQIDSILSVGQVLQSHHIVEIEQKVAKLHGVKYGVAVNSGTDALKISFKASGIGYGAKILTTPLSFIASTGAILEVGASPIFLDVGNDMHVPQETYIAALDRFNPDGILLVHLFGGVYD
jgi:dTDP-4-amino-4,6-dideoxygalactose transaminase